MSGQSQRTSAQENDSEVLNVGFAAMWKPDHGDGIGACRVASEVNPMDVITTPLAEHARPSAILIASIPQSYIKV